MLPEHHSATSSASPYQTRSLHKSSCSHIKSVDVKRFENFNLSEWSPEPFSCDLCGACLETELFVCTSCNKIFCTHGSPCHVKAHFKREGRRCSGIIINCVDSHVFCVHCGIWLYPRELHAEGEECRHSEELVESWLQRYGRRRNWWTSRGRNLIGRPGIMGIKNFENTCFFTSTLQCLLHCHPLLVEFDKSLKTPKPKPKLHDTLIKLALRYWTQDRDRDKPLIPRQVFSALQNRRSTDFTFGVYREDNMEDSSTLLLDLLNGLSAETQAATFGAKMCQICSCDACDFQSQTEVQEFTLSLPLLDEGSDRMEVDLSPSQEQSLAQKLMIQYPNGVDPLGNTRRAIRASLSSHRYHTLPPFSLDQIAEVILQFALPSAPSYPLTDLIKTFFAHETLTGDMAYECDRCQRKEFTRWVQDEGFITPSLERFLMDRKSPCIQSLGERKGEKLKELGFPPQLLKDVLKKIKSLGKSNAKKYTRFKEPPNVLAIQLKRFAPSNGVRIKRHDRVIIPTELDLSPWVARESNERGPILYDLYAVNVHEGGMGGGHNMAFCRVGNSKTRDRTDGWWWFSDDKFNAVNFEEVLSSEPYLLFYEQRKQ